MEIDLSLNPTIVKPSKTDYDLIIIGSGPAGLTAGIYAARAKLSSLIIEKAVIGGLATSTDWIENYPGYPEGVSGTQLMNQFTTQAKKFGVEFAHAEVLGIELKEPWRLIKTPTAEYRAKAVIIATGTTPKKLNIPGEAQFSGRGVSYCATCDGPFFKDKDVVIIGTGSSGLQEGLFLLKFVKNITYVEFLPEMTGEKILQERISRNSNVKFYLNHIVTAINGEERVESVTVKNRSLNEEFVIPCQGIFVYVGFVPKTGFLKDILELDRSGYIITNENLETSISGIFAAGDVRHKTVRQIATASSDGATAAVMVQLYLESRP